MKPRSPNKVDNNAINKNFDELYNTVDGRVSIYDNVDCVVYDNIQLLNGVPYALRHQKGRVAKQFLVCPGEDFPANVRKVRLDEWNINTAWIESDGDTILTIVLLF